MRRRLLILSASILTSLSLPAFEQNTGDVGNTVCFVRFADEEEGIFERKAQFYESLFNASQQGDAVTNSVYNYFLTASFGQLKWTSHFMPKPDGEKVISLQVSNERSYYQPYDASAYPNGYADATAQIAREQALVKEIAKLIEAEAKNQEIDVDKNNDGIVDNLTIILSGNSMLSGRYLLWPHRSDLALPEEKAIYIGEAKLTGYLMVFDGANGYSNLNPITLNTGVLCHEMSHSLGTYDLYHASGSMNPVGVWDLMSDNQLAAQEMSSYTKWRYCKWIEEPQHLTESGTYTLAPATANPLSESITPTGNKAYIISPEVPNKAYKPQYFVVEYRKKHGFDSYLPQEGLIVYRINSDYSMGNLNYNGTTRLDEMYVLRPGGTTTTDGNINNAALALGNTYNAIAGSGTLGTPFYQDGTEAAFTITDVAEAKETISFTLTMKQAEEIPDEPENEEKPEDAIIWETFEHDGEMPEGWEIQTTEYRPWHCEPAGKTYTSHKGDYTATVFAAWDDIHQDESLISPAFSHGKEVILWSRSNSCGRTPRDPQYFLIEISVDGGTTWKTLMNLPTDQDASLSGKWNEIKIDLTDYDSDNQKLRFRCYDTSNTGLSYFWQLDNIAVIGTQTSISSITTDDKSTDALYNLSGQRVNRHYKGITIKDGKKIILD